IDDERAKVLHDLAFTGCVESAALLSWNWEIRQDPDTATMQTDGKIAVVRLNECLHPTSMPVPAAEDRREPSRLFRLGEAVRADLIRSNPISLVINARRMVAQTRARGQISFRLRRTTALP